MFYIKPYIIYSYRIIRVLTIRKIWNYLLLAFSLSLSKMGLPLRFKASPAFISVEPANHCQLQCPECPVGTKSNGRVSKQSMSDSFFADICDQLKANLLHIIFYFQGEPLLDPTLHHKINIAHKAKIFTSLSTNAQILTQKCAHNLVTAGLDKIIISIDGATQQSYEKYRIGGSLQKALNGIAHMQQAKKDIKSATPIVELQFIVFATNEHEIDDIKTLARQYKVDVLKFKSAQIYDYKNGHPLLTSIDKYARYKKNKQGQYELKQPMRNSCKRSWMGAVISSKAELLPCCFDKMELHSYGNIDKADIVATWNNKKAVVFRNRILNNRKQIGICQNCTER